MAYETNRPRKGARISARAAEADREAIRANEIRPASDESIDRSRNGTVIHRIASARGELWGKITTACPARTGTDPNFTFHNGLALLYKTSISPTGVFTTSSTGRTVKVYNDLNIIIPVRPVPIRLEYRRGVLFAVGGDCIT